jgi:hypothetical protein
VPDYAGFVPLAGREGDRDVVVGDGESNGGFPFATGYHDARTQVIYVADELGGPGRLLGLSVNLVVKPGQTLNRFTIRLKHTPKDSYSLAAWETGDWTIAYQRDLTLDREGWTTLLFDSPFAYNGTNHLMVDFSFNNAYFTTEGFVRATSTNAVRTLMFQTDSQYGDPLAWTGTALPFPTTSSLRPNLKWVLGRDLPIVPAFPVEFRNGRWTGWVSVGRVATHMVLVADDGLNHRGLRRRRRPGC